ncbi:MAG: hypothetical protein EXR07_01970 [Acetobacteraceae bacterium]|nr:hypothetical protein [Acetobacteraceae bacterium]
MNPYLLVNGSRVESEHSEPGQAVFRLTLPAPEIRLISGYGCPRDMVGIDDDRRLGVALRGVSWRQGQNAIDIRVDSPAFVDGFHTVEYDRDPPRPFRWTNGNAALPPDLTPRWEGGASLALTLSTWEGSAIQAAPSQEAALLGMFESLGDNCELGLAQRHHGVGLPLTLFRWAGTTYEKLLAGLENRFAGLGDPDSTEVVWNTSDYRLHTPYLNTHTAAAEQRDTDGVAEIFDIGRATLRLLRRKLLRDIETARRIFVFRTENPSFGPPEMRHLHGALRRIGPASLLCVTLRQPGQQNIQAERLADGLYAGYLDRFPGPDGTYDEWLALCTYTLILHADG